MSGICITAKSKKGQKAIQDVMDADPNDRSDWKNFFIETIEWDSPYRIRIEHKNRMAQRTVTIDHLESLVIKQLKSQGMRVGIDYEVERL